MKHYIGYGDDGAIIASFSTDGPPELFSRQCAEVSEDALRRVADQQDASQFVDGVLWVGGVPVDHLPVISAANAQCRLALIQFGIMPEQVDAEIEKIQDPVKRATVSTLWHYRETFRSDNETLQEMAEILGVKEQLRDMLRLAATL